jgi:YVTN family beta-propeller protein
LHYENTKWVDVTTSNDTTNDIICGQVNSFSLFVIAEAISPPGGPVPARIYLSNQTDNPSIVALDPATLTGVASIPVNGTPGELVGHPDGSTLYAITGTNLSVIDVLSNQEVNTLIGVGDLFHHLAISPDGSKLYLLYRQLSPITLKLKVFDTTNPTSPTLITTISNAMFNGCYGPLGLGVSPDGSKLYAACRPTSGSLPDRFYMVDTATNTPTQTATFAHDSSNYLFINALTVKPDGSQVYVARANSAGSTVEYFDGTTGAHVGSIPLPTNAMPRAGAFTPDGSKLYVVDQTLGTHVINPVTNTRTKTISAAQSRGLDVATWGSYAYTTLLFQIHKLNTGSDSFITNVTGNFSAAYQITVTPGHP